MNREIKFRAWHEATKTMVPNVSIGTIYVFEGFEQYSSIECIFMQYTGLKDKNGKEIYEGDILATSNDGTDGADVWSKEDWGYSVVREDTDNMFDGVRCRNWYPTQEEDSVFDCRYVEVIGNIYENPDLLK